MANTVRFRVKAVVLSLASVAALTACGGGGGGGSSSTPSQPIAPASVSGDMVAYQASRGWNYQGNAFGQSSVTVSVYADPGSTPTLVAFGQSGLVANAFGGQKLAGIGVQNNGGGYNVLAYVLLNNAGGIYAQGAVNGSPTLVPATLVQAQSFATYPGVTATVQSVGAVPGANACPVVASGATVQYTFAGGTYLVSYVPGCGITNYVGNNGEHLTLVSVGSYPQLGAQSIRRMDALTVLDSIRSLARVIFTQSRWHPFSH